MESFDHLTQAGVLETFHGQRRVQRLPQMNAVGVYELDRTALPKALVGPRDGIERYTVKNLDFCWHLECKVPWDAVGIGPERFGICWGPYLVGIQVGLHVG